MKIEVKLKIVVNKKYFYTVERDKADAESYKDFIDFCNCKMMNFIFSLKEREFIRLDEEESGIKSINKRVVDEILVEACIGGKDYPIDYKFKKILEECERCDWLM